LWAASIIRTPLFLQNRNDSYQQQLKQHTAVGSIGTLFFRSDKWTLDPLDNHEIGRQVAAAVNYKNSQAAFFISTSGSAGIPKIVCVGANQLIESAKRVNTKVSLHQSSRWMLSLLPCHIGGLSIIVRCIEAGATLIVPTNQKRATLYKECSDLEATHISLVPSIADEFISYGNLPDSLKCILLGGEKLNYTHRIKFSTIPQFFISYGSTETSSCIAVSRLNEVSDAANCVGNVIEDTTVKIRDASGKKCDIYQEGLIEISGPTINKVFKSSEVGHTRLRGNSDILFESDSKNNLTWYSNDLGYLDEFGRLHVLGRSDDIIISGGVKISSDEIVETTLQHFPILEAAVTKVTDEHWGERPFLFIAENKSVKGNLLYAKLREILGPFKAPRDIVIIREMPRTTIGKINHSVLKDLAFGLNSGAKDSLNSTIEHYRYTGNLPKADAEDMNENQRKQPRSNQT
jgi:O-succinylbenzoic acid--CoA ligase